MWNGPGMLVDNRVVLQFRVRLEVHTNGHHRLFVETLQGDIVEVFDGATADDVERQLRHEGLQRIPPGLADQLDLFKLSEPPIPNPSPRR